MNQIGALRAFQKRGVDIGTVNHGVRVFEAVAKSLTHGKAAHLRAIHRIHHDELFGEHSPLARVFAHT